MGFRGVDRVQSESHSLANVIVQVGGEWSNMWCRSKAVDVVQRIDRTANDAGYLLDE